MHHCLFSPSLLKLTQLPFQEPSILSSIHNPGSRHSQSPVSSSMSSSIGEKCLGAAQNTGRQCWTITQSAKDRFIEWIQVQAFYPAEQKLRSRGIYPYHIVKFNNYFRITIFYPFYLVPWVCIFIWWGLSVKACEIHTARQIIRVLDMDAVCWQSSSNVQQQRQWWEDLWNRQSNYLETLPTSIELVLVSHVVLAAAEQDLRGQISELKDTVSRHTPLEGISSM